MSSVFSKYEKFIESRLSLVNKEGIETPFILNPIQKKYIELSTGRDIILKARQQGFSSLTGGIFIGDFILDAHSESVVIADVTDNAIGLLDRVKFYLKSYEDRTGMKIPLKYNSKYALENELTQAKYTVGTAENVEFGRSKTIKNLHMSEAFFYKHFQKLLASALQAVRPDGKVIIESTANGYNEGKDFWDQSVLDETGFAALFFKASDFYPQEFLAKKRKELGRLFPQEYPETPEEAFLTSGNPYIEREALEWYQKYTKDPINMNLIYA